MTNKHELLPIHASVKSFYNKAIIGIKDDIKMLYSYNTLVAKTEDNKATVYNLQSATTLKHVKEFLLQEGFKVESKKQLINDYMI